jgi:glutathione S-transferase
MMKLYDLNLSGHCHKVRLLLSMLKIPHSIVPVDFMGGEHRSPAFLKLNSFGQIPVLVDGDLVLRDSHAIMYYLAVKYDSANNFLPRDPADAARVMQWIPTAASEIYHGPNMARLGVFFKLPVDVPRAQERSREILKLLNDHLATRQWLELNRPTLADLSCYPYVALAPVGDVPLEPYAHVQAWIKRFEALPGYVPLN